MSDQKEFSSENINGSVECTQGCKVKVVAHLSPASTQAAHKKALKAINKEISVPGFRRGKAPDAIITKQYASYVEKEWKRVVADLILEESIKLTEIYPFNQAINKVDIKSCTEAEGAEVHFEYERDPTPPLADASAISLDAVQVNEVTDGQIDKALEDLRYMFANYEEVSDRPIQQGDYVTLTIYSMEEGKDHGTMICESQRFELADGKVGHWMIELLSGRSSGEVVEGVSRYDSKMSVDQEKFKETPVRVHVDKVEIGILPEVGDELALRIGSENSEKLRENVRNDLTQRAQKDAKEATKESLKSQLLELYTFDVPESLFLKEKKRLMHNHLTALRRAKTPDDSIRKMGGQIEEEAGVKAERNVKFYFLMREIAKDAKIEVTRDEMVNEYNHQYWLVNPEERYISEDLEPDELRHRLFTAIMMKKAEEILLNKLSAV